jgi:uncharacterized alpha-E superfamily protein
VAVLRSCSALDGYRQTYGADVQPARIAELLVLSDEFPRSVRACVAQLDRANFRRIAGTPSHRFTNDRRESSPPMKRIGILTAGGDTPALNATIAGAVVARIS